MPLLRSSDSFYHDFSVEFLIRNFFCFLWKQGFFVVPGIKPRFFHLMPPVFRSKYAKIASKRSENAQKLRKNPGFFRKSVKSPPEFSEKCDFLTEIRMGAQPWAPISSTGPRAARRPQFSRFSRQNPAPGSPRQIP